LAFGSEEAAVEVEVVKEVIAGIRNIRGENRISPAQAIAVRLDVLDDRAQKILSANKNSILRLGKLSQLDIGTDGPLIKCAVAPISIKDVSVKVVIPLEGLVDFGEEIKRINKTIEKLNKDIASLNAKLSNEKFVQNADEDVVAADRELLDNSRKQLVQLQEALVRFQ
jgi:valyl-tRNA synthetase